MRPRLNYYPMSQQPIGTPKVRTRPTVDLYLSLMVECYGERHREPDGRLDLDRRCYRFARRAVRNIQRRHYRDGPASGR